MSRAGDFVGRVRAELSALCSWWIHELRDLGEAVLGRIAPRMVSRTVIHIGRVDEPVALTPPARNTRCVMVLSPDQVLRQELVLPDSVERDLDQVIALHLERELPLVRDRVSVDYHVASRSREERRIRVQLFVARREQIEQLRERAQNWGVRLTRIGVAEDGGRVIGNFLRGGLRSARRQLTALDVRLSVMAAALALALVGVVLGQWIYERVEVGKEIRRVSAVAATVNSLAKRLAREAEPAEQLAALVNSPDATDVLVSLTAAVPRDSWAYELQVTARAAQRAEIKLSGFSPAATTLVDVLERMPQFEKVQLESALSAGLGTAQDRLQLVAVWASETASSPKDTVRSVPSAAAGARQ